MRSPATLSALLLLALVGCVAPTSLVPQAPHPAQRIAFLAHSEGFWQVWIANADGSGARQLTRSPTEKARVSWFPDGRELLVDTQEGELLRVDAQTGFETAIPLPVAGMLDAVLSPDGRQIAFSLTQSDSPDANEIWVCDLDGSNLRQLTNRAGLQHEPAWDPTGVRIYYLSNLGPSGSHDIWRIAPDGSEDERLTFGELRHLDVAVSSRGEIAYSGNQRGSFDVWLKAPKLMPVQLTEDRALDAYPSFSGDGEIVVFESSRGGSLNIWRVARGGGQAEPVTRFAAPGARRPVWAPEAAAP
ncbi:MAG: hypothetical protein WEF50_10165 [Myxococcota bacterium]